MGSIFPVLLSLFFLCLVEVYSLTVTPYLSLRDRDLTNHSYVKILDVNWYNRLLCHSKLHNCCSRTQGDLRGEWVFPNGTSVTHDDYFFTYGVFQTRKAQRVELIRPSWIESPPNGLYRCEIAASSDKPPLNQSLCVGLYTNDTGETVTLMEHLLSIRSC